jgi:hypothetical protein
MTARKASATASAKAGPSTALSFAQDDSICLIWDRRRKQIPFGNDKQEEQQQKQL